MKYIVSVPLMHTPTPCAKLIISFANDLVHCYRIYLFECLVRWKNSTASIVSESMISNEYLGREVCAVISILISTSEIFRRLFMTALPHGDFVLLVLIIVRQATLPFR